MKNKFLEDYSKPEKNPLDARVADFDWQSLYAALGEAERDLSESDRERLGLALMTLLRWVVAANFKTRSGRSILARRVVAAAWVIDPGIFGGVSLSELARCFKVPKASLSQHAAEFSRTFGVRNRGQSHAGNFKPQITK